MHDVTPPSEQAALRSTVRVSIPESSGHASTLSHDGAIYAVHTGPFRPNAENTNQDFALTRFDTRTAKRKDKVPFPRNINAIALDPVGARVLTGEQGAVLGGASYAHIWDLDDAAAMTEGRPLQSWEMNGSVHNVQFLPDGNLLLASFGGWIKLIDPVADDEVHVVKQDRRINFVALTPDSRLVLHNAYDAARLWDLESGALCAELQPEPDLRIGPLQFSPNGSRFFCLARQIHVYDTASREKICVTDAERHLLYAEFSPCGRIIMALRPPGEFVWFDASTGEMIHKFDDLGRLEGFMASSATSVMTKTHWVIASYKSIWEVPLPV